MTSTVSFSVVLGVAIIGVLLLTTKALVALNRFGVEL